MTVTYILMGVEVKEQMIGREEYDENMKNNCIILATFISTVGRITLFFTVSTLFLISVLYFVKF